MNKSELFKRAWKLARDAKKSFGGNVRQYFSTCLENAWREFKKFITGTIKNGTIVLSNGKTIKNVKSKIELIDGMQVTGSKQYFLGRDRFTVKFAA